MSARFPTRFAPAFTAVMVLIAALASPTRPAACADPEVWEVWYSVRARVRDTRADADIEAGGRLSMTGIRTPSGSLHLSLQEVLEHPWKLYWVNPLGPLGEEVKMASVVTLPEASWAALEAARIANALEATTRHRQWLEHAERPRELDGSFAFVVVGAAQDRFQFAVGADGMVADVKNRMTQSWLSGPFDQFVGTWGGGSGAEVAQHGYWFWNQGEKEPFGYEPHTYHAFATALELLALPLPPRVSPSDSGDELVRWSDAGDRVTRVLEILAPRANLDPFRDNLPPAATIGVTREPQPDGSARLLLATPLASPGPHIERKTVVSSEGWPISDQIRVRISSKRLGSLEVEVGYRTPDLEEESR